MKKANSNEIRIRMYRVGFGDFFLMTVPSVDGPKHIVVDCGVTNGRSGKGDIGTIKDAVAHMAAETGGKLALIIATHRHMDHIIGFSRCKDQFEKFEVEAIWMPVWETEYDDKIAKMQSDMTSFALEAQTSLAMAADTLPDHAEILAILENATGIPVSAAGMAMDAAAMAVGATGKGGGSNPASLEMLKKGFGVKPKYYGRGDTPELPASLVKAGLTAKILGPPPKEEIALMKLTDLRKGVGQYLGAAAGGHSGGNLRPFSEADVRKASDYPESAFREWNPQRQQSEKLPHLLLEEAVETSPAALMMAAKQLNDFLNNQSLVVLFTFQDKSLLFAGDAQAGNWEGWLYDDGVPSKTPGDDLSKTGASVLKGLSFYKVGHHGSTNATPIVAVEHMGEGFVSMCSTEAGSFGSVDNKSEVPRDPLMAALARKSALVRSDQIPVTLAANTVAAVEGTPKTLPKPKVGRFEAGDCYIDYFL